MKASSIPMKASKAEVRAILPKGNEEQDNDDWAKFEVSAVPHTSLPSLPPIPYHSILPSSFLLHFHNLPHPPL